MSNPFKPRPIEIERVVPLTLDSCRRLCDTMIQGLLHFLDHVHIRGDLSPWTVEKDVHVTTLEAGRALKARLEFVPADDDGTSIRLKVSGVVLVLWRKEILQGIMDKLEEMGGGVS